MILNILQLEETKHNFEYLVTINAFCNLVSRLSRLVFFSFQNGCTRRETLVKAGLPRDQNLQEFWRFWSRDNYHSYPIIDVYSYDFALYLLVFYMMLHNKSKWSEDINPASCDRWYEWSKEMISWRIEAFENRFWERIYLMYAIYVFRTSKGTVVEPS